MRRDTPYLSYSVRIRENADQNNSEYGRFLRSACCTLNHDAFKKKSKKGIWQSPKYGFAKLLLISRIQSSFAMNNFK